MTARVLTWALAELQHRHRVAIATVLNTVGSVPGKTGARLAVSSRDDAWVGTVGGAGLERNVLDQCHIMLNQSAEPSAVVITYGLNKGAKGYEVTPLDSLCGGRVTVSIEVMIPMPHLLIMGGGHCGEAIATSAHQLEWSYSVHDSRAEYASHHRYPHAVEANSLSVSDFLANETDQTLRRFSDILLLGHDWSEDQERLIGLLKIFHHPNTRFDGIQSPRIGVIGSRSKWLAFQKTCIEQGIVESMLEQVKCPIGLPIGAQTPQEIAIAVVADILACHKGKANSVSA